MVKKLTGGLGILSKQRKVHYMQGRAAFENSTTLRVTKSDGAEESLTFDRIIIATGSRPAIVPTLKLDTPRMMDSTGALNLERHSRQLCWSSAADTSAWNSARSTPRSARASPSSKCCPDCCPGADRDLVLPLHKRLEKMFDAILLNTTVAAVKDEGNGIRATFEGAGRQARRRKFSTECWSPSDASRTRKSPASRKRKSKSASADSSR